jgi:sec-independent protein translocase protein TatB
MLDFGFSEILLTSAIALVVLGPERLPKVARQVGNWMGRARAMARQLSEQLEREVDAEALLKDQMKTQPPAPNRLAPPPYEAPQYVPPAAVPDPVSPHAVVPDPHTSPDAADEAVPGAPGVPDLYATAPDANTPASAAAAATGEVPHLKALEPGASPPPLHIDTRNPPHE